MRALQNLCFQRIEFSHFKTNFASIYPISYTELSMHGRNSILTPLPRNQFYLRTSQEIMASIEKEETKLDKVNWVSLRSRIRVFISWFTSSSQVKVLWHRTSTQSQRYGIVWRWVHVCFCIYIFIHVFQNSKKWPLTHNFEMNYLVGFFSNNRYSFILIQDFIYYKSVI